MKFSYNWLKELVDFKQTPNELADLINLHVTEVETVSSQTTGYNGVIVTEILEINLHPNADKLKLVVLDVGRGKREEVVCGASNIEIGQKVPLAMVGAQLPGGTIKKTKIRGVESRGMICSAAELGFKKESDGILVLSKQASVGRPVNEVLELSHDSILDLKVLSNRPDYLSYVGIAREIAAVLNKKWEMSLDFNFQESSKLESLKQIKVEVKDQQACPVYSTRWVSNIEVRESPDWLKEKLISTGIRPINNLVDISNLVMLEIGQPVHIFDAAKVKDKKVIVRRAKPEEKIITLDEQTRILNKEVLVIADSQSPIALAGIMGGAGSAISDLTKEIVIEVANFNPLTIRKGSKSIGLSTDASLRFERNLSPYLVKLAMARTLSLIQSLLPDAVIAKGNLITGDEDIQQIVIDLQGKEINNLLGTEIKEKDMASILERLDFSVKTTAKGLQVVPPPFRLDIKDKTDLAEEIARVWGIHNINPQMPHAIMQPPAKNHLFDEVNELKDHIVKFGFNEVSSHCFIGEEWAGKLELKLNPALKLANPLNANWTHLSSYLWPNLLQFVSKHNQEQVKFFEINTVFNPPTGNDILPQENKSLAILICGYPDSYRILRGVVEDIVWLSGKVKFVPVPGNVDDHYINILRIMIDNQIVGGLEGISPQLAQRLDVPVGIVWAELNLNLLLKYSSGRSTKFKQFSYYPSSTFDISIKLPMSVSTGSLIDEIKQSSLLIQTVDLFDVYQLEDEGRSVGLRIILQSHERTLNEGEIKTIESKIINLVTTKYRGEIRGSENE